MPKRVNNIFKKQITFNKLLEAYQKILQGQSCANLVCRKFFKTIFLPQFIQDSYACIEGKETHKAVEKMQNYLRKANRRYEEVWVLKCDKITLKVYKQIF